MDIIKRSKLDGLLDKLANGLEIILLDDLINLLSGE